MKIQYAIDPETGLTYSRIGNNVAVPIRYKRNKFGTYNYRLMKFEIHGLGANEWMGLKTDVKLPPSIRHHHNQFWNKLKGKETT